MDNPSSTAFNMTNKIEINYMKKPARAGFYNTDIFVNFGQ